MQGGPPPCTPRRSAGGRPIGQEISKIRGGNMKQNPLKSRGLWGVREWNRKKMYPSGWKHYAWVKKTLRRTFVSLWKNCFSPFGRKNNHFFLGKQKFASEFFCPWHKVSTQKEHIYPIISDWNLMERDLGNCSITFEYNPICFFLLLDGHLKIFI